MAKKTEKTKKVVTSTKKTPSKVKPVAKKTASKTFEEEQSASKEIDDRLSMR